VLFRSPGDHILNFEEDATDGIADSLQYGKNLVPTLLNRLPEPVDELTEPLAMLVELKQCNTDGYNCENNQHIWVSSHGRTKSPEAADQPRDDRLDYSHGMT